MTRATHYERAQRSAPRSHFSGGYTGHKLTPARERALWDYAIIGCSIAVGVGVVVVTWGGIL